MPLKTTENLLHAEERIIQIFNAFFYEDGITIVDLLTSPTILKNMEQLLQNEGALNKAVLMFYKTLFDCCQSIRLVQQEFDVAQFGIQSPLTTQGNITTVVGEKLKEAIRRLLEIQVKFQADWPSLLKRAPIKQSLQLIFHILSANEDPWGLLDSLKPLLLELSEANPRLQTQKHGIHISLEDVVNYKMDVVKNKDAVMDFDTSLAKTNDLKKIRLGLLKLQDASPLTASIILSNFNQPLVFNPCISTHLIEEIQMDFAFFMIKLLSADQHPRDFLLPHIENLIKLHYLPEWLQIPAGATEEMAVFNLTCALEIRLRTMKKNSLVFENKAFAMNQQLLQLCKDLVPLITVERIESTCNLKESEELALNIIEMTKKHDDFVKEPACLFFIRPLHILIQNAEKTKSTISRNLSTDTLKHLERQMTSFFNNKDWLHLGQEDQGLFLTCSAHLFCQSQLQKSCQSFFDFTDTVIEELCTRQQFSDALLLLGSRYQHHKEAKDGPHFNHYQGLFHLILFLDILPKTILTDTTPPTVLEQASTFFIKGIQYKTSNNMLGFAVFTEMLNFLSPQLLQSNLKQTLKNYFFSKIPFFEMQLHVFYFLFNHKENKTTEHIEFKNVIMRIAYMLGQNEEARALEARLLPLPEYMVQQDVQPYLEKEKPFSINIITSITLTHMAQLTKKLIENDLKLITLGLEPKDADYLPLMACFRYYNAKTHQYSLGELSQNEALTLYYAKILRLMNLPLRRAPLNTLNQGKIALENKREVKTSDVSPPPYREIKIESQSTVLELKVYFPKVEEMKQPSPTKEEAEVVHLETPIDIASTLINNIYSNINTMKAHASLKHHLLNHPTGIRSLHSCIFFYVMHDHLLTKNDELKDLIDFMLEGNLSQTEKHFLEYLRIIKQNPDPLPLLDNPFLQAYILTKNGHQGHLSPLDYGNLPNFWVTWNKLFLAKCFLDRRKQVQAVDEECLKTELRQHADAGYFLDCKEPCPLSFLKYWKKNLVTLRTNYNFIHKQNEPFIGGQFFIFRSLLASFNEISIIWFNRLKSTGKAPDNQFFALSNAKNYLTGSLSLPTENKKQFLSDVVNTFEHAKKNVNILTNTTNAHLNQFIVILVQENLFLEAANMIACCLNITGPNELICKAEHKDYQYLLTIFKGMADFNKMQIEETIESFSQAFHQLRKEFLKKQFPEISIEKLKSILKERQAPKIILKAVDPSLIVKQKKKKKKSDSVKQLVGPEPVLQPISEAGPPVEEADSPILPQASKFKDNAPGRLELLEESEPPSALGTPNPPGGPTETKEVEMIIPSSLESELSSPKSPEDREENLFSEAPKPLVIDTPSNADDFLGTPIYTPKSISSSLLPIQSPVVAPVEQLDPTSQIKQDSVNTTSPRQSMPTNNKPLPILSEMKTQAHRLFSKPKRTVQMPLITAKFINKECFPSMVIELIKKLKELENPLYPSLVGNHLVNLLGTHNPASYKEILSKAKLLLLCANLTSIQALPYLCNFMKKLSFILLCEPLDNGIEVTFQDGLSLEIEIIADIQEKNLEDLLFDYLNDKTFNLECLCIPLELIENSCFYLKGSFETVGSLNKREIRFVNSNIFDNRFSALLLLARLELQLLLPFHRSNTLTKLINSEDLYQFFADEMSQAISTNRPLPNLKELFSWRNLRQIIDKMAQLNLTQAMTVIPIDENQALPGLDYYHVQQRLIAIDHWPNTSDSKLNCKHFSLFMNALLHSQHTARLQECPGFLKQSMFMHYLKQTLKDPAAHCYMTVIEDWALGRESTDFIPDNHFFTMLQQLRAHDLSLLYPLQPYYTQAYPSMVFWSQAPLQPVQYTGGFVYQSEL